MPNIAPIYMLPSVAITVLGFALLMYWRLRRKVRWVVVAYALAAFASAILIKLVFQTLTRGWIVANSGNPFALGIYYGLQTVILEVGIAYVLISYAVRKKKVDASDAEGYGIGLAFWENGVLLGALTLVNLLIVYLTLAGGGSSAAAVYNTLLTSQPQVFVPPSAVSVAQNLVYSIMERTSSIMLHFSWGYLALMAAFYKKRKYLIAALPMGMIDFLVPFASSMGLTAFEVLVLALSLIALAVALVITRGETRKRKRAT